MKHEDLALAEELEATAAGILNFLNFTQPLQLMCLLKPLQQCPKLCTNILQSMYQVYTEKGLGPLEHISLIC